MALLPENDRRLVGTPEKKDWHDNIFKRNKSKI